MTSPKLVVVTGATGMQGGSVISALSKDPSYKLRGITRNPSSEAAKKLKAQGVEVVAGDLKDLASLKAAFEGAHVVFANTNFWETLGITGSAAAGEAADLEQGKNLADAAAATQTLEHYVWSTIPSALPATNGKFSVPHFEGKAAVDEHILNKLPDLAKKTTFLWVSYYGLNNLVFPMLMPVKIATAGKYIVTWPVKPETPLWTTGDTSTTVGLFVEAILKKPELSLPAKYVKCYSDILTTGDLTKLLGEISKKDIEYVQVRVEDWDKLWPVFGMEVTLQLKVWETAGLEKGWSKPGVVALTKEDLKIEGLVGLRHALTEADWSPIV